MKNWIMVWLIAFFMVQSLLCAEGHFELATVIEKAGDSVVLSGGGYTRLSLVRFSTNISGMIFLTGKLAVSRGSVNLVMWSKVNGKYYFFRLPGLQNIIGGRAMGFVVPFSSPKDPVSEVILEVELPEGGKIRFDHLGISME